MDLQQINALITDDYAFFLRERNSWSLTAGPQDLELVAHAMRVLLHAQTTSDFLDDYTALEACQNTDGGWSPLSSDTDSTVWVSAFCGLMLIRANRLLGEGHLTRSVQQAIDYFLDNQHQDGRWVDPAWADLDTTSHPVSFFNVVVAQGETHRQQEVQRAWEQGLQFIIDNQSTDGGWYDREFHPSGVEITAHLIQDALVADLVIDRRVNGVRESCAKGVARLSEWQAQAGSWDDDNVDHTMDCTRSLMLVTRILGDISHNDTIMRGLGWIMNNKNEHGWGDFPGMETNLERTCDGLDTMLKYKAYCHSKADAVIKLWGYLP